jgi:membrane-bound serine protease (ClpP class)
VIELIHKKDGSRLFVTRQQLSDLPDRDVWNTQGVLPMVGDHSSLMFTGKQAVQFGIAQGLASDWASVLKRVGISSAVPTWSETWVDHVVVILNHPVSTAVLLGTGLVFLYIELATAGIGLATLPAALCFMLFFWSKILGGTATWLEVLLFLAGVACLIIELLVIPGFGVVGVTGIVLIVASVLMAIQGFLWPQSGAEVQTFGRTIVQLVGGMILFGAGAVTVSRYLQVSPTFRQFILQPSATAVESFNLADNVLNAVGVSVTDLHPSGKIRLGERILDVVADGCFVRAGERVRVMDVEGNRIRVSKV